MDAKGNIMISCLVYGKMTEVVSSSDCCVSDHSRGEARQGQVSGQLRVPSVV